jgi:hypothetical protein
MSHEYMTWQGMKQRCLNDNHIAWAHYGGRGIDIDPRWVASFETFLADVGPKSSPGLSIDRIDNDKGYWPGNVRWATAKEQRQNQRRSSEKISK